MHDCLVQTSRLRDAGDNAHQLVLDSPSRSYASQSLSGSPLSRWSSTTSNSDASDFADSAAQHEQGIAAFRLKITDLEEELGIWRAQHYSTCWIYGQYAQEIMDLKARVHDTESTIILLHHYLQQCTCSGFQKQVEQRAPSSSQQSASEDAVCTSVVINMDAHRAAADAVFATMHNRLGLRSEDCVDMQHSSSPKVSG